MPLLVNAQSTTASLAARWDPSPDPAVTGYHLFYGTQSGVYLNMLDVGNVTNASVTGLLPGCTYFFAVTAYDAAGNESDQSNEASGTTTGVANYQPTLDPISDQSFNQNAGPRVIYFTGVSSGSSNEVQTLTVTASSSNPSVMPAPQVIYGSPNRSGALTLWPAANAVGTAIISITVDDGGVVSNTFTRTFTVTVNAVNQAPTISTIAGQTYYSGTTPSPIAFTVGDLETAAGSLTVSAASSNATLIPVSKITFGGSNANRTVLLSPVAGQAGSATITITVSDGTLTTSTAFSLVVKAKPAAPSGLMISTL
ncbi:MAG: fibronectin type III domain-containing protein [Verrucomicrobiota bacterium]